MLRCMISGTMAGSGSLRACHSSLRVAPLRKITRKKLQRAIAESLEAEAEDQRQLLEDGYDSEEDAMPWPVLYEPYLFAVTVGHLFIVDGKALSADGPDAGKLLVAWFDECGRVVSSTRQTGPEAWNTTGLIFGGYLREHSTWMNTDVGEEYEWDAPLRPPFDGSREEEDMGGN